MEINWLWDSRLSQAQIKNILEDQENPRFYIYAEKLLSRVSDPQKVFSLIDRKTFCQTWPVLKKRLQKDSWLAQRIDLWQMVYRRLSQQLKDKGIKIRQASKRQVPQQRMAVAKQIKDLRLRLGYSQKNMAERIGVIQQYLSRVEKGDENLTVDTLSRIAQVFHKHLIVRFK